MAAAEKLVLCQFHCIATTNANLERPTQNPEVTSASPGRGNGDSVHRKQAWATRKFSEVVKDKYNREVKKMVYKRKRNRFQKQSDENRDAEPVSADWAGLPKCILEDIFERLPVHDCISVSNVCKSWRSAFSPVPSCSNRFGVPSLFMSGQKDREKRTCVSMVEKRAWEMELPEAKGKYCWGSFHDWLILVGEVKLYSLDVTLLNPFTRAEINLPRTWDLYHKLVLSAPPSEQNSVSMLLSGYRQAVQFWVPGAESWHEYKLAAGGDPFEDAVFSNGSFFLVTKDDDVLEIDAASVSGSLRGTGGSDSEIKTRFRKMGISEIRPDEGVRRYLVESRGGVLLVRRYFKTEPGVINETRGFEIHSLDFGSDSWRRVESLGDRVLFLGKCCSMAFSSAKLQPEMGNSIYFSNDDAAPWWNEWHYNILIGILSDHRKNNSGRKHWGVFKVGNEDDGFCFRGDRDYSGPIWFTVPLWWYRSNFYL